MQAKVDIAAPLTGAKLLHEGTIIAVCYSPELVDRVRKEPHSSGRITKWGIPGDYHYGETRVNSRGKTVENNRPITVIAAEPLRAASEKFGIEPVPAGGMGENLLTDGLGDLSDAEPGDRIVVLGESGELKAVLHAWSQNPPCSNVMVYHREMVKELYGKRGLLCTVLQEGEVSAGDRVQLVRP